MADDSQEFDDEIDVEGFDEKEGSSSLLPDGPALPSIKPKNESRPSIKSRSWKEFGVPVCDWSVDDMDPESRLTIEKMLHEERRYLRNTNGPVTKRPKKKSAPYLRWTQQERQQFEQGFMNYGNRWTQIARLIPTRSALQVKNYARYYFPAKLKSAADQSIDDMADQERIPNDAVHPHLPESLDTASPTVGTRPRLPTARAIPNPSRRRHFQKFGFANLSPSRVLKSRSGKDALASRKRISEGRSATKSRKELAKVMSPESNTLRPSRKMRGRGRRARVKMKDASALGQSEQQGEKSKDVTGGGNVDFFEQGGGVVWMRPESSEDEDVDVEDDAFEEGDKQENLLMGLAVACDRLYNNLITPTSVPPTSTTVPSKRKEEKDTKSKTKAHLEIPDRSNVRGQNKVISEPLSIPELPWNADHTYSMSLRTLHKLGILRGASKPRQEHAERTSESRDSQDSAQRPGTDSPLKVVALTKSHAEDFIGSVAAFSSKFQPVDSLDELSEDGEIAFELKTEPGGDDKDVVWNIARTECHISDEPCHVEDTAWHVKDEPCHMEDESCHTKDETRHVTGSPCHMTVEPCHVTDNLCQAKDEPCHVTDHPCHITDELCHVTDHSGHATDEPCHMTDNPCHVTNEPCHAKDEFCHLREEACNTMGNLCHMTDKLCHVEDEMCHVKDEPCHVNERCGHMVKETCPVKEEPCDKSDNSSAFGPNSTNLLKGMHQATESFTSQGFDPATPHSENPDVQSTDTPVGHPVSGSYQEQEPEGCVTPEVSRSVPQLSTVPAPLEINTETPETEMGSDCETGGSNQEDENRGDAVDKITPNTVQGEADSSSGGENEQTTELLEEYRLDPREIEDWERQALPEFFKGRPTKTPERYLKIRNYIYQQWLQAKPKYLNKAAVRQGLKSCGDVNCIGRVHHCLEKAGAINHGVANPHRAIIDCRVNSLRQRTATKTEDQPASRESKRPRKKKNLHPEKPEEKLPQRKSTRSGPRKTKAASYDPFKLIECCKFSGEKEAPFHVRIQSDTMVIMDVHSHMSSTEVIGLLGGTFCKDDRVLDVLLAVPCNSISTGMQCEMDPVSQTEAYESILAKGYQVVGWYHSHPAFAANPSVRDIETQAGFQGWFSQGGAPFIGIIVSPCHNYQISQSKVCCLTISTEWSPELKCRKPYQFDFTVSHSHSDSALTMDTISGVVTKFSVYKHRSEMLYLWSRHYDISFLEKMLLSIKTYMCPEQQGQLLVQIKDYITAEFTAKAVPMIKDDSN